MNQSAAAATGPAVPYDIEIEQALLGAVLIDNFHIARVTGTLKATDFYDPFHQRIWLSIEAMHSKEQAVTPLTVFAALFDDPGFAEVGGRSYLTSIARNAPALPNTPDYARILSELATRRALIRAAEDLSTSCYVGPADLSVQDIINEHQAVLSDLEAGRPREGYVPLGEAFDVVVRDAALAVDGIRPPSVSTGITDLDKAIGGLQAGDVVIVAGRPGMGKAQPVDAMVLTVTGWKRMGDIVVGDEVATPSGGTARVCGVYPQGVKPIFKVTFHDGRSTHSCGEHLWRVWHRHWGKWRDVELKQIIKRADVTRFSVPLGIVSYPKVDVLPLAPYLVGALLGDGYFHPSGVLFSTADLEIVEAMRSHCPAGHHVVHRAAYDYAITTRRKGGDNFVLSAVRQLGLGNMRSHDKFVPPSYLNASFEARRELLRGLLDTDGTVERDKTIRFSSTSEQLAKDVVTLARSVGGWARIRERARPRFKGKFGKRCWVVTIRHRAPQSLFSLQRKTKRLGDGGQYSEGLRLSIASIRPAGEAECQCISIDDSAGLYFTDGFTVTHNTIVLTTMTRACARDERPALLFSLEMTRNAILQRMVCDEDYDNRGPSDKPLEYFNFRSGQITEAEFDRFYQAQRRLRLLPHFIWDSAQETMESIGAKAERIVARSKTMGVVCIDYLQIVTPTRYMGSKVAEVTDISMKSKRLAKRLGWPVVLGCQLSRETEKRSGGEKRPTLADLRESGAIEQDGDIIIGTYRPEYYVKQRRPERGKDDPKWMEWLEEFGRAQNKLELILLKNKHGPTYTVRCFVDVGSNAIREIGYVPPPSIDGPQALLTF